MALRLHLFDRRPLCALVALLAGHTSVDPLTVQQPTPELSSASSSRHTHLQQHQQHSRQPQARPLDSSGSGHGTARLAAAVQPLSALHVRGKSGLKHTKQLLDCWLQHPDWPQLTVIGPMPNEQITGAEAKAYMAAPNIHVPHPGKQQGKLSGCVLCLQCQAF